MQRTSPFCRDIWRARPAAWKGGRGGAGPGNGLSLHRAVVAAACCVVALSLFRKPSATPVTCAESVFHWSGDNSETARRDSGRLLLAHLEEFNRRGPFHVVAHSHGGSVLMGALCLATDKHRAAAGSAPQPLANLKSWTTVGTPFFHFRPDYWRFLACPLYLCFLTPVAAGAMACRLLERAASDAGLRLVG